MNIVDIIPKGRDNAIKGDKLADMLGVDERTVRELVMKARNQGAVILNVGGGNRGYFIPVLPEEIDYVHKEYDAIMGRIYPAQCSAENLREIMNTFPI